MFITASYNFLLMSILH